MVIVLAREQAESLALMALDLDVSPETLLEHLLSDRLAQHPLTLWSQ